MGKLERKVKKETKRANVQQLVLDTIAVSGMVTAAVVAPNVIGAMGRLGILPSPRSDEVIRRAQNTLIKKGFLKWEGGKLRITEKGKREHDMYLLKTEGVPKPRRWDGKWRIIIFDIPHSRASIRTPLRRTLIMVGFYCLQRSVWVYPYDCEEAIALIKSELRIGNDILYIIADAIENDKHLKTHFDLLKM